MAQTTRKGFTLAEVLITLGIIGVVAAITMPILITDYQEQQSVVAMKKIYSEISQVNQLLNTEYDGNWMNLCDDFDDKCFRDLFASKIKIIKKCDNAITEGCQAESKTRDNSTSVNVNTQRPSILTASGSSIKFRFHFTGCESNKIKNNSTYNNLYCGWIQADINGLKGPNILGKDIFFFQLFSDGTVRGWVDKDIVSENGDTTRTRMDFDEIEDICKNGSGQTCAAYYLAK